MMNKFKTLVAALCVDKETAVALQEEGRRESLRHLFHLRVGEREPYLRHLARREETVDKFDVRAQEGHVFHALIERFRSSRPHT